MSFTVSCITCGVMFISSIGIEPRLGGGAGLALVLGNVGPVLGEASGVTGPNSKENLVSRVCNLLNTMSPRLKRSSFLSLNILTIGLNPLILERTLKIHHKT